jgi:hypothetical protein
MAEFSIFIIMSSMMEDWKKDTSNANTADSGTTFITQTTFTPGIDSAQLQICAMSPTTPTPHFLKY